MDEGVVSEPRGQKRKKGGEDDSADSDEYDKHLASLSRQMKRIPAWELAHMCYDKRLAVWDELQREFGAPAWYIHQPLVEHWALGIKARLDAIRELAGRTGEDAEPFQKLMGNAMAGKETLSSQKMIGLIESAFGIRFSCAIVPLGKNEANRVLWLFDGNDDNDPSIHNYCLAIRSRMSPKCREAILGALRDPEEAKDHERLCEVLPRLWLIPSEDTTLWMKNASFQATRCTFETAQKFKDEVRVYVTDYCFVSQSLCELHEANMR
jgi:hypothetical protein